MPVTLREVVTAIRLQHPAFGSDTVPNRALGEALGEAQRELALLGYQRRPTFLSQQFSVAFALNTANRAGVVGAATSGGLPSLPDTGGVLGFAEQNVGIAPVYDLSAPVFLAPRRVITGVSVGVSTTTLTFQGSPAWTVDAFLGDLCWVTDGPGEGPHSLREIVGNTANTIEVDGVYAVSPVANASVGAVIAVPDQSSTTLGVATGIPGTKISSGYLVKLDSTGTAYLDLTSPVVAQVEVGIPLPPMVKLLGVECVWNGSSNGPLPPNVAPYRTPVTVVPYALRDSAAPWPSVYQLGSDLFLRGLTQDWVGAQSLDLRYAPIPPMFSSGATALDEYFLLPDFARTALVAWGCLTAATFAEAKGLTVNLPMFVARQTAATQSFIRQVSQMGGVERLVSKRNR